MDARAGSACGRWHNLRVAPSGSSIPRNTLRERRSRRRAQIAGACAFLAAAVAPALLWRRAIAAVASDPQIRFSYLAGWTGYALIALGLAFLTPVVVSIGRRPGSRLYPRSRNAYVGWGVTLYLLGTIIAIQVAAVLRVHPVN